MIFIILSLVVFCDVYWYLQYHDKEYYWYGCGWMLKWKKGIKRTVITRVDNTPYLIRYSILQCRWFSVKVHKILVSDDACLHDHPWAFVSVILKNGYVEETFKETPVSAPVGVSEGWKCFIKEKRRKIFKAPAILFRPAYHAHRLEIDKPVTTLVITFKREREWGFFTPSGWKFWKDYKQDNTCE